MPPRTRAENRAEMESEIRRLGREHLRTHGAAGLSLRAIARDLGVVSSAVYRYVPSRDDLLTMLLVEAYTDLADTVDAAVDTADPNDRDGRLRALTRSVRRWGTADPARWALLYGSPVPGYAAPAEVTVQPGTRVIATLLRELTNARPRAATDTATSADTDPGRPIPDAIRAELTSIRDEFGVELSAEAVLAGVTLWSNLIGAVSLEVFGQYGTDTFTDPAAVFDLQMDRAIRACAG